MDIEAVRAQNGDCPESRSLAEHLGQNLQIDSPVVADVQDAASPGDEPGHVAACKGCVCGGSPDLDGCMAVSAWEAFRGLKGGMCDCSGGSLELIEPTLADLKNVKDCVEHVFAAHKEWVEISPGTYLDRKEARGYLVGFHCGRGLLQSAQLAHDVGVQLATQLAWAEKEAAGAAQAARQKARRAGAAAGPGGPREKAGEDAAAVVWAREAHLPGLPAKRTVTARPKTIVTPKTSASDAHRTVDELRAIQGLP